MSQFQPIIITASAGTGKTYRLALEYIRLVLQYYRPDRRPEFDLDSILVLTFTRKATAEIKERIQQHIQLLCSTKEKDQGERNSLIQQIKGGKDSTLSQTEMGILDSVNLAIMSDRRLLQVMTIDSYIASIFRNIVRPMRSIGEIEVDTLAVQKRMPYLLSELMQDELKDRVDSLLRRKMKRSLDEYAQFFASLIYNRWLYQMIFQNLDVEGLDEHIEAANKLARQKMEEAWEQLRPNLKAILSRIQMIAKEKDRSWEQYFSPTVQRLFHRSFPVDPQDFVDQLKELLSNSRQAMTFFDNVKDLKLYDGRRINSRNKHHEELMQMKKQLRSELSDHLYYRYFLPEQYEILQIWAGILEKYDQFIYRYKNMTYDDISWFTLQALFGGEPPAFPMQDANVANEFYQFLTHRSRFILIDEFQDTSLMQFQILKPIIEEVCAGTGSKDFGGLIVVGDEKQSIFGWRGGERELLLKLENLILPIKGNVRRDTLDKSYRTSAVLMELINSIFGYDDLHGYLKDNQLDWHYDKVESAVTNPDYSSHISFQALPYQTRGNVVTSLDDLRTDWVEKYLKPQENSGKSIAILCRTNNELVQMQGILDEAGITSVYQPNAELPEHHLVQPLISYLRWIAYGDWTDWLIWLRSDYIRIKPALLKKVLDQVYQSGKTGIEADFSAFDTHLQNLYLERPEDENSPYSVCQDLVIRYLDRTQISERDQLNLDAFLNLVKEFELDSATTDTGIPAFLQYLEDLREQDKLKQISIEGKGGVQLLSIHKSKGLQFDSVFVFYNLSSKGGGWDDSLDWYMSYRDGDFSHLDNYALSYHYGKVLEYSHLSDLYVNKRKTEHLEEMNNLYVALTRAKTSLHVLFAYEYSANNKQKAIQNAKDSGTYAPELEELICWDAYLQEKKNTEEKSDRNLLPYLVCNTGMKWIVKYGKGHEVWGPEQKKPVEDEDKDGQQAQPQTDTFINADNLAQALDFALLEPDTDPTRKEHELSPSDAKKAYLTDRALLLGEMRHYYLSHLVYNSDAEQEMALRRTINVYASLLSPERIKAEIERLKANIARHEWLFDARWDKVYNEIELVLDGKRLRLDRLMIDSKLKAAMIVDYKSGDESDPGQLATYKRALQQLPALQAEAYEIETRNVSLKQ